MDTTRLRRNEWALLGALALAAGCAGATRLETHASQRLLYVAAERAIHVYDIDANHVHERTLVLANARKMRGIVANAGTRRLYVTYKDKLVSIDLLTDEILWKKRLDSGADRLALTPDGRTLYVPSGSKTATPYWYVIDAMTGEVTHKIDFRAGAHNTIVSLDGGRAYLASLRHDMIAVVDTRTQRIVQEIGPFGGFVRPFTIDESRARLFATVDDLLGFEVADLHTGKIVARVEVPGFPTGPVRAHHCPSHGIGLTPDGREVWVVDAFNQHVHVFDLLGAVPRLVASIRVADEPYWIAFGLDGRTAYASTGDVIDVSTRRIVGVLRDPEGARVRSEKMLEIDFANGVPVSVGDQFGLGRKPSR